MPSEVWKLYEANPRDFMLLAAYSRFKAEREEEARAESEAKTKQEKGVRSRTF